jgi:hypothetical protein
MLISLPRGARALALALGIALLCLPSAAAAADGAPTAGAPPAADGEKTHAIIFLIGGVYGITEYSSFLKLGGGYNLHLKEKLWLDLASTVLVQKETNFFVDAGVRWRFGQPSGWRWFLHVDLELGGLFEVTNRFVIAGKVGGGAGYYSSPSWGFTLGSSAAIGPSFGGGVHFASAIDFMLGIEILL